MARILNIFIYSETGSWRRKRISTIRPPIPILARVKANNRSSNPLTLVLYIILNKSWILQIFPRILYKISKNPIAITPRVPLLSIFKSYNPIVNGLNPIKSFPIR